MNNPNPETHTPKNNFDGQIVRGERSMPGIEALLQPGDVITATEPLGGDIGGAPIMAKIDLGEHGSLSVIRIDVDDPNLQEGWKGQLPLEKYQHTMAYRSLLTVWTSRDYSRTLYSDVMALAGSKGVGQDNISGGAEGTKFYRWGDREDSAQNRQPRTLPDDIPEVSVARDQGGNVTIKALSGAKDVKVHVLADQQHEEVLGGRWADEIEAGRRPVPKRLAAFAQKLADRFEAKSYHK